MYKQLANYLDHTRLDLFQACEDIAVDFETLDYQYLAKHIEQCTHCDIWTKRAVLDLDKNPICVVCRDIAGL